MQTKLGAITVSIGLGAGIAACSTARGQIPEGWEIVEIFPAGTEYYCGPPDINDRGQIVFHRRRWPSRTDVEIMLYDRGSLLQLTDDVFYDAFPQINIHGHVAWQRDLNPAPKTESVGIVFRRGANLQVISDEPYYEGDCDLNDAGHIVWKGLPESDSSNFQLFRYDGFAIARLTDDRFSNQSPHINQRGQFIYTQYDFSFSPYISHVIASFDSILRQLTTGQLPRFALDLNDSSEVLWSGPYTGLELWRNGITIRLLEEGVSGSINNRGDIATSPWDAAAQRYVLGVLRDGKFLPITDAFSGGGMINERGEVAFGTGGFPYIGIGLFTKASFRADLKSPCAIRSRVFIGFTRQPSGGSWCDRGCAAG